MRWYSYVPENCNIIYNRKCPPNNSVYEEWTTIGLENDGSQITFVEYEFYDKDPDGVREAFDCMYDSEYKITVDISRADSSKLFAYTITKDQKLKADLDIDISDSRAIYIFTKAQNFTKELLLSITEKIENNKQEADKFLEQNFARDKNVAYLIILNDRM